MIENAIIIINQTRLQQQIQRFNTKAQAKFYIEHSGSDFKDYESEDDVFNRSIEKIIAKTGKQIKYKIVDRRYLPNFLFSDKDVVIVAGQDGLVANTAKYAKDLPIIAINPDTERYDGILLPFNPENFETALANVLSGKYSCKNITMAEVRTNDEQRLLAFNDFFIGVSSHVSARYKLTFNNHSENQSSSGIIVSTGAGSTGWLSSLINMTNGIQSDLSSIKSKINLSLKWDDDRLIFIVREPFLSKKSQAGLTTGFITNVNRLTIESYMPVNGVIFSDGIESDFLQFNSGSIAEITLAGQKARLVVNS
jgi:NAD kinase